MVWVVFEGVWVGVLVDVGEWVAVLDGVSVGVGVEVGLIVPADRDHLTFVALSQHAVIRQEAGRPDAIAGRGGRIRLAARQREKK